VAGAPDPITEGETNVISTAIVADPPDVDATPSLSQINAWAFKAHRLVHVAPWTTLEGVTLYTAVCQCGVTGHRRDSESEACQDLWAHFDDVDVSFRAMLAPQHRATAVAALTPDAPQLPDRIGYIEIEVSPFMREVIARALGDDRADGLARQLADQAALGAVKPPATAVTA